MPWVAVPQELDGTKIELLELLPSRRLVSFLHIRQTCFIYSPVPRELDMSLEHALVDRPRRLERSRDKEVRIARLGAEDKWPLSPVRLHQLADDPHAVSRGVPLLILRLEIEQILQPMSEGGLARAPEELLRARRQDVDLPRHHRRAEDRASRGAGFGLDLATQLRRQRHGSIWIRGLDELRNRRRVHHVRIGWYVMDRGHGVFGLLPRQRFRRHNAARAVNIMLSNSHPNALHIKQKKITKGRECEAAEMKVETDLRRGFNLQPFQRWLDIWKLQEYSLIGDALIVE